MCFIVIYVDDMVVFCHSEQEFEEIRAKLGQHFKLYSLGDLRQFLGIHIEKVDGHYTMCQDSYIKNRVVNVNQWLTPLTLTFAEINVNGVALILMKINVNVNGLR